MGVPRGPMESGLHEPVALHEGPLTVHDDSDTPGEWDGRVFLTWLPSPRVVAEGAGHLPKHVRLSPALFDRAFPASPPSLSKVSYPVSVTDLPPLSTSVSAHFDLELRPPELGRRGSRPDAPTFNVINGPDLRGEQTLQAEGWIVTLSPRHNLNGFGKELAEAGGFGTTHTATVRRIRGGRFSMAAAERVRFGLAMFLTFIAGRTVGTWLPVASLKGQKVWESWESPTHCDPARGAFSWFDVSQRTAAPTLWPAFLRLWLDADQHDALRGAISFSVLANKGVPAEVGLSLAVSGLDLLGWQVLVLHGPISRGVWEGEHTSWRIEQVLNWASIPTNAPAELRALRHAFPNNTGPEAVTKTRNNFIHRRPHRGSLPFDATIDVWLLAAWYLELSLLNWLGYTGQYKSRLDPNRWVGATKPVPWAVSPTSP